MAPHPIVWGLVWGAVWGLDQPTMGPLMGPPLEPPTRYCHHRSKQNTAIIPRKVHHTGSLGQSNSLLLASGMSLLYLLTAATCTVSDEQLHGSG